MASDAWEKQKEALGGFIRAQRKLASLSLRQLSEMTDVSNAYLSQIERGLHEPSIRVLRSVAAALGISAETLLEHAGLLDEEDGAGRHSSTEDAIRSDPNLTDDEKTALLSVYRSYTSGRT